MNWCGPCGRRPPVRPFVRATRADIRFDAEIPKVSLPRLDAAPHAAARRLYLELHEISSIGFVRHKS